jgi:hypothetical protein
VTFVVAPPPLDLVIAPGKVKLTEPPSTSTASFAPPGYRGPVPYGFGVVALTGHRLEVIARLTEVDLARLRPNLPMRLEVAPLYTDDDGQVVLSWAFAPLEVAAPAGAS